VRKNPVGGGRREKLAERGERMRLNGKVAIVTGGARGLGRDYAVRLSEEGAKVVIADILDATAVQREIEEKGGEALALHTDVIDEEGVHEMARKTEERFGRIDILVNNAAIFADVIRRPFYEISVQEWDKMIGINLKGTFLCCKAVYPQMKKQGKGKIINVSSATFFSGNPYLIHYVTSKGGVIAFTRVLAREVGNDGICVNAIAPGFTLSEAVRENPMFSQEVRAMVVSSRCLKRPEQPDDLTGTIVFLASDESDFITGQTIVVDGGSVFH
jgi:NAD(P)-dependent dehydrogenase (short-subunit alcohol dehydrogenase family)